MSRRTFLIKRLLLLVPVLFGVATFVFFITKLAPGNPARLIAGKGASAERIREIERSLGLTKPIWEQYLLFLWDLLHLDFGRSYVIDPGTSVLDIIRYRLPVTVELAIYGQIIGILVGIPLGVLSAVKQDTIIDHVTRIGALTGFSIPVFYSGPIFILIFAQWLNLLPASGRIASKYQVDSMTGMITVDTLIQTNFAAFFSAMQHLILPVFVLGVYLMALISRMMRSTMLDELRQDYIQTARSKGQGEKITVLTHGFRNALIPVVTVIGLQFGTLLGGAVLTETVFGISGIGLLLVEAINSTDFPVVQGTVLVFAVLFTGINLMVDLTYSYIDPRIKQ